MPRSKSTMTQEDHEKAFMKALEGIPSHIVARALRQFTRGIDWTRASKTHMADSYASAQTVGDTYHNFFKKLTDLGELRAAALKLQQDSAKFKAKRAAAQDAYLERVKAERIAKDAEREDAKRWRAFHDAVEAGKAQAVVFTEGGHHGGKLITNGGDLVDAVDAWSAS